jgi:hypothetical protein
VEELKGFEDLADKEQQLVKQCLEGKLVLSANRKAILLDIRTLERKNLEKGNQQKSKNLTKRWRISQVRENQPRKIPKKRRKSEHLSLK